MSVTLSNKYYIQALEAYPHNLTEVMESLNYALSYDAHHAGAHCLFGRLYMEQLKQYPKAEYHFEQALANDICYPVTYELYSMLLLKLGEYDRSLKLINYSYKIKGIDKTFMLYIESQVYEYQRLYKKAKKRIKEASKNSCHEQERTFLKAELERIRMKANGKRE